MVKEFEKDIEEDIAQESVTKSERQEEFAGKDVSDRKSCSNRSVSKQFLSMVKKNDTILYGNITK